ncbi:pilus assembly PilX family protein [Stutzerimonas stutzeri]
MKALNITRQQGATLLVALVMLLILTVLAVSSMRGVVLESRITGNWVEALRMQTAADAALREGEVRFYGPTNLRDKLEPKKENCQKSNTLKDNGANKPCLLDVKRWPEIVTSAPSSDPGDPASSESPDESLHRFILDPTHVLVASGADTKTANNNTFVTWMPYRGTIADTKDEEDNTTSNQTGSDIDAYWNSHLIIADQEDSSLNPEYGAVMEGRGTYFYLVNGQAADELTLQSTTANIYLGLNH